MEFVDMRIRSYYGKKLFFYGKMDGNARHLLLQAPQNWGGQHYVANGT
jgi:hypothetical protein